MAYGPTPKPNARRQDATHRRRSNAVLPSGGGPCSYDADFAEFVLRRIDQLRAPCRRWARAALSSPQAATYTDAEVALLEVGALILHRWLVEGPNRRSSELNEFGRINDRLLGTHAARLRAHVELAPLGAVDEPDALAARRDVRERLT